MSTKATSDEHSSELNRVMHKIRLQHHGNESLSSFVTLEKVVETLATERDEWKAKAEELERQLKQSRSENNELKSSLEKESKALANCADQCRKEIASVIEKKNDEMKEVLECLVVYKNQLMSTLDIADDSCEIMITAEEDQRVTYQQRHSPSQAEIISSNQASKALKPPRQNTAEIKIEQRREDSGVEDSTTAGTGLANLLSFSTQKIIGGRQSWKL